MELESNIYAANWKGNKDSLSREYRDRCLLIWRNFKDDDNFQLRRKYISGDISAKEMTTCQEEKLMSPLKLQQQLIEKQKFYNQDVMKKEAEQ